MKKNITRMSLKRLLTLMAAMLILFTLAMPTNADETTMRKTVRVSCGVNNSLYLNEKGKPEGYLAYYVQQLAYVNNWELEYVNASWNDSVQNLYNGKIDLLFPTQITTDREYTMAFSDYIGGYQPIALYAREDAEIYYDDFETYNGLRIAVSEGTSNTLALEEYALEHNFSYISVDYNTTQEKLDALRNGVVDMILFSTLNDVPNSKIVSVLDYLPFYFSTRIDDTELMAEVNGGMRAILIENPTVASTVYSSVLKGSSPISFTREENEVIQSIEKIRVGVYDDSLPMSGSDKSGKPVGIYIDLLKKLEEKSGIEVEPVLIPRNKLLYSCLSDGTVDFVIGSKSLAYNEADTSLYMCSEPIMDYITAAITMPNYKFDSNKPPRFIITQARKYWVNDILALYPNASIAYCDDAKECLSAVLEHRADVTLINTWEFNYQTKNARFSTMLEWESLRKKADLVLGVKKGTDAALLSIMEKSIDRLAGQDKDTIIATNLNMPYSSYDFADRWYSVKGLVITVSSVAFFLAIALFVFWRVRKKYTQELENKNEQLEKSNEAKDVFLSRMSHELRTPLNAINGYASVMHQNISEHRYDEKKSMGYVESILRACKYQLAIIGDLLDIQKIESGKMELNPIAVVADEYIESIAAMIKPEANEKEIEFAFEKHSKLNDTYLIDGIRFQQVLLNILHNAVKFTPKGGKVTLTAEAVILNDTHNILKFVISDTGIGMSEDFQQNYLFHRFAQEYKGATSPYEGCGTGLALSREILHLMGGEITCESKQGEGSVFTVVLTAKHISKRKRRSPKTDFSEFDLSGTRILLCEDNQMNQDIEKQILEKMNCTVDIAADGQIGVDMFAKSAKDYYNIILMDIRMPNMDGLEATRTIRAMEREDAARVPIIAVSANSFEEDVQKSLNAGMNEHLSKPVDVRVLFENIKKFRDCVSE